MSDRAAIMGRIRKALGSEIDQRTRENLVRQRLQGRPRVPLPARALLPPDARLALMEEKLIANGASVTRAESAQEVVQRVADAMRERGMPMALRIGSDALLSALPWSDEAGLNISTGRTAGDDAATCAHALAGAAETGTLFLASGADNPTTLNYLPELAIIVLRTADLYGGYEDAFDRVRAELGASWPPRAINLIGGPSRTADIEQTIIVGAHGPRSLHVILWGDGSA